MNPHGTEDRTSMIPPPRILSAIAALLVAGCLWGCGRSNQSASRPGSHSDRSSSGADGATPAGDRADTTVHALGFGPVHAGMTLEQAEAALGESLAVLGPRMEPCFYVRLASRPGVAFMVIDGRVARVDVQPGGTVKTAEGVGIGDTEERVRSVYTGRVDVEPHKYVDGHYLIVRPAVADDTTHRVIFETDGRKVTGFRAGRLPEVRWIEGCS